MLRGGRSAFVRGLKGGTNEIDGIDGERRASEFREFKEFREIRDIRLISDKPKIV